MLKTLFKTAIRNIKKNKLISAINIIGLSLGITVCLIICQYVSFKSSYDKTLFAFTGYASLFAIFVAGLGLIGLSLFMAERKVKEIGIRKVNGARTHEILVLLNSNFIKWISIAFVIACPLAYLAMNTWLQSFAYKTTLSWWIFILAGFLALIIALLTVSWQTYRAARRNPVEALRYE
ncbi:MAG: FtsX-like permease family protein [Salinivirgaceae bacterium]|nr:FtsX-like permease family protein [Salinivirgaceae bacterium]